jgi:hypothetical protein
MNTQKRTGLLKAGLASMALAISVTAMPTTIYSQVPEDVPSTARTHATVAAGHSRWFAGEQDRPNAGAQPKTKGASQGQRGPGEHHGDPVAGW